MKRETSILCYHQIKSEGLLSKMRMRVYESVYQNAPCTSAEAFQSMKNNNPIASSRSRFSELRELGVIYERGVRKCRITGRTAIEWDLTDRLPISKKLPAKKRPKKYSAEEVRKECINFTKYILTDMEPHDNRTLTQEYDHWKSLVV